MKITLLGTGTFYVSKIRSGPAYLLEVGSRKILIDCGPGTLIRLSQIGLEPKDLDYIFVTHFHADHTTDLFALQMNLRLDAFRVGAGSAYPVVYGPKGITDFTKKLSEVYQLPGFDDWSEIKYIEYPETIALDDGLVIQPFQVQHVAFGKVADAYSLRFEHEDRVLTLSGDSTKHQGVEDAAKNADVFICDTSSSKGKGSPAHMDTLEIGEIATSSGVKSVILTHFYPRNEGVDLVSEVKEKYTGEVVRGEDFMEIEV